MGGAGSSLPYRFIKGEITDTRLMGVVGMHLHWDLREAANSDLHQFFYFDVEELGLDQLLVYRGSDPLAVELSCKACFGGLGGKMVGLSEAEGRWLAKHFVEETKKKEEPVPENLYEIEYILEAPAELSEAERLSLGRRMCTPRSTDNAVIHYFLMRLFGQDPEGAALLAAPSLDISGCMDISVPGGASFLMNTISVQTEPDGSKAFLCESLVEADDGHWMVFSEIGVSEGAVCRAALKTRFRVTASEASLKLRRTEYVSVFEIRGEPSGFEDAFAPFVIGATATMHECGTMYMEFKPHNLHVERPVFNLSDDIEALYFVSEFGQLIVGAYSYESICRAEARVSGPELRSLVFPTGKYKFPEAVLFEFAQSGFDDFNEFISSIQLE